MVLNRATSHTDTLQSPAVLNGADGAYYGPGARPFLDDRLAVGGDDLLRTAVQFRVLDEAIPVGEPGATLLTTVGFLTLQDEAELLFRAHL